MKKQDLLTELSTLVESLKSEHSSFVEKVRKPARSDRYNTRLAHSILNASLHILLTQEFNYKLVEGYFDQVERLAFSSETYLNKLIDNLERLLKILANSDVRPETVDELSFHFSDSSGQLLELIDSLQSQRAYIDKTIARLQNIQNQPILNGRALLKDVSPLRKALLNQSSRLPGPTHNVMVIAFRALRYLNQCSEKDLPSTEDLRTLVSDQGIAGKSEKGTIELLRYKKLVVMVGQSRNGNVVKVNTLSAEGRQLLDSLDVCNLAE